MIDKSASKQLIGSSLPPRPASRTQISNLLSEKYLNAVKDNI